VVFVATMHVQQCLRPCAVQRQNTSVLLQSCIFRVRTLLIVHICVHLFSEVTVWFCAKPDNALLALCNDRSPSLSADDTGSRQHGKANVNQHYAAGVLGPF
jgi:hypothetical protein